MISKRPRKRVKRSPAEKKRIEKLRDQFQRERPSLESLLASGDFTPPMPQRELFMMLELAAALKEARRAKRLSLADLAKRSGIDKAALSRIENGQNVNPTVGTLETIARSLGARLSFSLDVAAAKR